ncbi:MAG: flagellin [Oscillospiraceae bacterium]|jgi:flagellin|nr:flagellin [Oscillospiraceae bacterium]
MGMVVRTNTMAMNAQRMMNINNNKLSKSLQKLSSGYKINSAADDAAGLAISEHMKSQIKGLDAAADNSNDGISLVQTAEGSLNEVHDMLNRMTELATKSANGVYTDSQRSNYSNEVTQLQSEIDRIADSTNFNGIKLLDGSLSGTGSTSAAVVSSTKNVKLTDVVAVQGAYSAAALTTGVTTSATVGGHYDLTVNYTEAGQTKSATVSLSVSKDDQGNLKLNGSSGDTYAFTADTDFNTAMEDELSKNAAIKNTFTPSGTLAGGEVLEAKIAGQDAGQVNSLSFTSYNADGTAVASPKTATITVNTTAADAYQTADVTSLTAYNGANADKATFAVNGHKFAVAGPGQDISKLGSDVTVINTTNGTPDNSDTANIAQAISKQTGLSVTKDATTDTQLDFKHGTAAGSKGGLTLQIGDSYEDYNKLNVSINDMHAKALGIGKGQIDISSQEGAGAAVQVINDAIDKVSTQRSSLGAIQNRLDHTINNLNTENENLTSANSRIRDTDMAKEMMSYTQNNVLVQAAQAMLAQANQAPSQVLQLLK